MCAGWFIYPSPCHQFHLIEAVLAGTNRTKALELYEQASDQGDTEGTFYLARAYQAGSGVKRNATHAVELYRAAISKAPSERFAVAPFLVHLLTRTRET